MERLLELMLYREAGGVGYDQEIKRLAQIYPLSHQKVERQLAGIKDSPCNTRVIN